ncbi:hypothetical protein HYH03_001362 [Edaphochlamys debaryana]|uniref:Uncharacterized protein n=1 Tax=Edaphochlamys debaryana TaxID=47281 RepID=A0A835YF32_9CHLO|nr:hypothetical protein HYH03_001362 [Edaphochlamys debaryana]|eukprot:KAG2500594.1 hypothetical protein HYH03_001362 [Edaphochlamys debaryana]
MMRPSWLAPAAPPASAAVRRPTGASARGSARAAFPGFRPFTLESEELVRPQPRAPTQPTPAAPTHPDDASPPVPTAASAAGADDAATTNPGSASEGPRRLLSSQDQMALRWGCSAGAVLLRQAVDSGALRGALAEALAALPGFAGRLVLREDGGMFDLGCTDEGARLLEGRTDSVSVQQVLDEMAAAPYSAAGLWDPWPELSLPPGPEAIAQQRLPLASVLLLRLSCGGCLLALSAYHAVADFEALQTFAAHLAAAYNARLRSPQQREGAAARAGVEVPTAGRGEEQAGLTPRARGSDDGGGSNAAPPLTAPPPDRLGARFEPTAVEALAAPGPPPPGVPPRSLDSMSHLRAAWPLPPGLAARVVAARAAYHGRYRGGGVEGRLLTVPAERLAALKARAVAELAEERARDGPGGELAGVDWVSTNDALAARLLQLLHALPLRRARPMHAFLAANMRRRLQPPLPRALLGNALGAALLEGMRPAELSLGRLAGLLRRELAERTAAHYQMSVHQVGSVVRQYGSSGLMMSMALSPGDVTRCNLAPEGPVVLVHWDVDHGLWQFGPERPLAFLPLSGTPANTVRYLASPGGGGVALGVWLHRLAWAQLDEATGGDLAAAL